MSAITAKASRKMKKYAVLTREPRCFLGSFDFSWEQRKLSEITDKVTEKNAGLQYVETFTNSAEFGIISQRDFFDHDIAKLGSLDGYYIVKTEDFVYNPRISTSAPVGPINRNKLGRTGVMSPLYTVFRPHDIDTTYLEYFFKCGYWHSFMNFNGDSGARSDRFSIRDNVFFQMPIPIPDIDEQRKIGELLTCLDNLITLHQRKCALLFSPFQAFISMMFTTSTFSWEQRKLSEMCGTFEYGLNAAAKEFDGKNKYIRITDIDDASREFLLSDLSSPDICLDGMSKYLLSSGDIVFARTGASVGKTYIYRENDGIVYFAGFLIRAKVNQDNDAEFVFQSTLSPSYEKYIRITSQRSGQPGVNAQEYGEYDLFAPSKEEQQRIGHFLRGIDNLITLHQRKCVFLFSFFRACISMNFTASTFSWEQRKVSELFRVTRGYVLAATQTETTKTDEKPYPVYSSQTKDKGLMGYYKDYLYEDAITWTTDGANAGTVNYRAGKFYCTNVCGVLLSNEVKANQMIAEALNSVAKGYVSYVGNPKLMNNVMADIVIQIPTQAEEREQLSSFFAKLDNLITLHQRELEKLQNIKKSMLEKMFV